MTITNKDNPVIRIVRVTQMVCPECSSIIYDGLIGLPGVQKVVSDWHRNKVTVTYNLHKVRALDVEKLLDDIGYPPHPGFLYRFKREWIHFIEQNQFDNLKHLEHCCNRPPAGV